MEIVSLILVLSQYLIKMLKFQVFEVLVEAWTIRRKTEQIGLKRTRNGILPIAEFNLASRRNDMNYPSFQQDTEGDELTKRRIAKFIGDLD
ncbi:hypothetical protein H5410_035991 [Solanum commersonii]|uniref:Uncharacterized protein n=1 Tax=Solanum commersonii TaxID=4109 RepID=A0A9J5Y4E3_SOLCO|nr:hypothetical protein H5410_035991 [Solanum commersonii]